MGDSDIENGSTRGDVNWNRQINANLSCCRAREYYTHDDGADIHLDDVVWWGARARPNQNEVCGCLSEMTGEESAIDRKIPVLSLNQHVPIDIRLSPRNSFPILSTPALPCRALAFHFITEQ